MEKSEWRSPNRQNLLFITSSFPQFLSLSPFCLLGCCLGWVSWYGPTGFGFLKVMAGLTCRTTMAKSSLNHRTSGLPYPSLSASWSSDQYSRGEPDSLCPVICLLIYLCTCLICMFLLHEMMCKQCLPSFSLFVFFQDSSDSSCLPAGSERQAACSCSSKSRPGGPFLQHIKASHTGNHPAYLKANTA